MNDREEKLERILTILVNHVGVNNAIHADDLAKAVGVRKNQLRADRHTKSSNLILELIEQGNEILSCKEGYYFPRPARLGGDEDRRIDDSWNEWSAKRQLKHRRKVRIAPVKKAEMSLFDD